LLELLFAGRPCHLQLGAAVKYVFLVNVDYIPQDFLCVCFILGWSN
jgi:hypothetical protein